ncbi:MAG: PRC-barrel domain-containing protein [Hyphomicrobiaceae bacterium]
MKKLALSLATVAALAIATPAQVYAQDVFIAAQGAHQYLAKDSLIGAKIYNDEGKIFGDIEDVILNDSNIVEGVIIGTGGFLGIGEKKIGVRLDALVDKDVNGKMVVALPGVSKDVLDATPEFKRAKPKKSLLERAKEKAKELTDKTTETSKEAYEKAAPTIEKAKEATKEAYDKAKEAAGTAYEKAKEAAQPAPTETTPAETAPAETPPADTAPADPATTQ